MSRLENPAKRFKADLGHQVTVQRQTNRDHKHELNMSYLLWVPTDDPPRLHLSRVPPTVRERLP